jgi:hypothetical protein
MRENGMGRKFSMQERHEELLKLASGPTWEGVRVDVRIILIFISGKV